MDPQTDQPDHRAEDYRFVYDQTAKYDLHYSTVRSGVTTVVITAAIPVSQFGILNAKGTNRALVAVVVPLVIFLFLVLLNRHFQTLTASCRSIQLWLEDLSLAGGTDPTAWPQGVSLADRTKTVDELKRELVRIDTFDRLVGVGDGRRYRSLKLARGLKKANRVVSRANSADALPDPLRFRANLKAFYKAGKLIHWDGPMILLVVGSGLYLLVACLQLATVAPSTSAATPGMAAAGTTNGPATPR